MGLLINAMCFCVVFVGFLVYVNIAADDQCWSPSTSYKISQLNGSNNLQPEFIYSEVTLVEECHLSFVQTITNKTCKGPTTSSSNNDLSQQHHPTTAEKYGYGFLAVFIISVLALAGFIAFPLMKKPYYKYINAFFTALAVGTLFADSLFELLPIVLRLNHNPIHQHEHGRTTSEPLDSGSRVPLFLWQMLLVVLTAYAFYTLELLLRAFTHHRHHHHSYNLNHGTPVNSAISELPSGLETKAARGVSIISTNTLPIMTMQSDDQQTKTTGWMVIIGDGIHNIADGLAIGAAFSEDTLFGVTTTIAIACHELPTELGEYMVLIESGFTRRKALIFNFVSGCTAMVGFFIGVSAAQNEQARTWIFSITVGTFAYIALVDLWPTLMPDTDVFDWIRFICVTGGYLLGVFVMFILTTFEDRIVSSSIEKTNSS